MLQAHKRELLASSSLGENCVAGLKERLWKLESSALEQQKIQNQQENTIKQLEQVGKPCPGAMPCPTLTPVQRGVIKARHRHLTQPLRILLWLPIAPENLSTHKADIRILHDPALPYGPKSINVPSRKLA